jgi:acyl-coenzyme A thioesterase PaaI-like protein
VTLPAAPEPGWESVVPFPAAEGTFLYEGNPHSQDPLRRSSRICLAYFRKPNQPELYAKAWFGERTMGPPGHVHGGAIAASLDEAMGAVCWMNGHKTVAANISVKFVAMLPLETETIVEAQIDRTDGRKIFTRASLTSPSGQVVAEAEGLFIVLKDEVLRALTP